MISGSPKGTSRVMRQPDDRPQRSRIEGEGNRRTLVVCSLLTGLVVLASVPYIRGLGFYSDDWGLIGVLVNTDDQSTLGLLQSIWPDTSVRPVYGFYLAALFRLFGLAPLGHHIVNHSVFWLTVVLLYLCLRKLQLPQPVAVAWPLVFATLPHYSTDRFWFAAFHTTLSVALYFVSLYAGLQAVSTSRRWPGWRALSVFAMVASVLTYEVVAPFFLLSPVLEALQRSRHLNRPTSMKGIARAATPSLLLVGVVLGLAAAYKAVHSDRDVVSADYWNYVWWLATESVTSNYVNLGAALPQKIGVVLSRYPARASLPVGLLLGLLAFSVCHLATGWSPISSIKRSTWLLFAASGFALSLGGYVVFLTTSHIGFAETGINNRTAIAAAVGVALAFVGLIGLAGSLLPSPAFRRAFFSLGVTCLCVAGYLINTTVASYWVEASREQQSVIESLRGEFPQLPPQTTVLLDGVCRYRGPGIVFETSWDVGGMLQVYHRDPTLRGDVLTSRTIVEESGISTLLYSDHMTQYLYEGKLLVYDVQRKAHERLPAFEQARGYFSRSHRRTPAACVEGEEGFGAPIF